MNSSLPESFLRRMEKQLGGEYPAFLKSYETEARRGIRINPLKTTAQEVIRQAPFNMEPVPWARNGFFVEKDADPAGHPFYRAGLYYIQEPSAMTPADRLPVQPGEKVLDLCAAPGGKATALAAKLGGEGLLMANDASASRCRALLHNLELFGAGNIAVTNELPSNLEEHFPEYFDKILVDAPCSGEGMFRKEPEVIKTWSPERVAYFAGLQRGILKSAVKMLRPGGLLMYSTCTFSPEENEGSVSDCLEAFPEMKLAEIEPYEGFSKGRPEWGNGNPDLEKTVRIWPHKLEGAGHFLALMKKDGDSGSEEPAGRKKRRKEAADRLPASFHKEEKEVMERFLSDLNTPAARSRIENRGGKVFLVPFDSAALKGLKFLRCGLYMGELKKNRFEPSQALALWHLASGYRNVLDLKASDARIFAYLKGATILLSEEERDLPNGLILVKTEGFPLGFGKKAEGILKNKYLWLK